MKLSRAWPIVAVLAVGLIACQPAAQQSGDEMAADAEAARTAIDELRTSFVDAFNAQDAATLASLYTEDAVVMPPGEPAISGREAIVSHFEDDFAQGAARISLVAQDVEVGDGWAWERGTATVGIMPGEEGTEMIEVTGKYIVILQQTDDGSWLLARDIWNENEPMAEMESGMEEGEAEEG